MKYKTSESHRLTTCLPASCLLYTSNSLDGKLFVGPRGLYRDGKEGRSSTNEGVMMTEASSKAESVTRPAQ